MAIGRPIELTPNIATKNISSIATADQTEFTVTGGYRINELAVYRNGVRLVDGRDFSATDGSTVTLISAAEVDDVIEFAVFDSFDIAGTIVSAASTQTLDGNLHVTGELFTGSFKPTNLVASAATFNSALHVGSALTANAAGDVETIGIITAATFKGDGSGLTGIGETVNVRTETITVSGVSTFTGVSNFSAAINADATTDSTSTSTGALIVDGGVGIAKNVYIGAGLSVAGTLTYEDVTNVDSVGVVTAKSGVNITGGQLTVGSGITMGIAGVATFSGTGDVHLLDNVRLNVGDGSDLAIYHDGSHSYLTETGTGALKLKGDDIRLENASGNNIIKANTNVAELFNNGNKKFETTNDGTVTTGIGTFTAGATFGDDVEFQGASANITFDKSADDLIFQDNAKAFFGTSSDGLEIYHDGSHSYIKDSGTGYLRIQAADYLQLGTSSDSDHFINCDATTGYVYVNSAGNTKLQTTNDGTVTTGIATATSFSGSADIPTGGAFTVGSGITVAATSGVVTFANGSTTTNALHFGSPAELKIYHDGGNHYIRGEGDGLLSMRQMGTGIVELYSNTDARLRVNGGETAVYCNYNSSVDLYHNNIKKFETTSYGVSVGGSMRDDKGDMRQIPANIKTSAYTLIASDSGKLIDKSGSGAVEIPNNIFGLGDTVSILNNSGSDLTITATITTLYNSADASTGNRTLAGRGMATIYFTGGTSAYISGSGLS